MSATEEVWFKLQGVNFRGSERFVVIKRVSSTIASCRIPSYLARMSESF